jgi:CAAX protease family protein
MILVLVVAGVVAVGVAWRLIALGRLPIWTTMASLSAALGVASLLTRRVRLSPRLAPLPATAVGVGAGVLLYVATVAFVVLVRRWPVFDRHVREIYDQRKGLSAPAALGLSALVTAPAEELFWRGLAQARLAEAFGWAPAAVVIWAGYAAANAASGSLPILAGGLVGGAVWGALAVWTHGVLSSACCHLVWTGLMVAIPPPRP